MLKMCAGAYLHPNYTRGMNNHFAAGIFKKIADMDIFFGGMCVNILTLHNKKRYDMKGRSLTAAGIFAAAIAAVLILCYNSISLMGVAITCGILFVAVGLINMIFFGYKSDGESSKVLNLVTNSAAIVLGLSMLVFREEFRPMVAFMFGLLVAVCSLWQFFVLALGARPYQLPAWLYLFPVVLAGGSVYIFINPNHDESILLLSTGIAMAVLGVACIIEGSILGMARHHDAKEQAAAVHQPAESTTQQITDNTQISEPVRQGNTEDPRKKKVETTEDLDDEIRDQDEDR